MRTAALLVVALTAALVAACGSGSDDGKSKSAAAPAKSLRGATVTMWVMNNGPDPVGDTERILKPFEKRSGIKVNVKLVGWDVQFDRIRNAAVSGTGPDITQAGTTQVPFFAALGGFESLDKDVSQIGGKSAYAPGIWETTQVEGQSGTWAVPWFTEARAIYYRKDALAKAGVDPATAFKTWDDFTNTLEKLKSVETLGGKKIKPFGGPGKKAFDLVHNLAPFIWSAGGEELTPDAKKSAIAEPNAIKGVEFYADLIKKGVFDTAALEKDGQGVEDMFKGGQLAVWVGGPWVLGSVKRSDDKTWDDTARNNLGVAPLPQGPSGKAFAFVGGSNLMMFKNAKNKDAAWAVMKFLSQDSTQKSYAGLMGMFPARLQPQEQVGQTDENYKEFLTAIKEGRSYAPIPQWAQVENTYKEKFGDILDLAAGQGGKPYSHQAVEQALQGAAKAADNLLAQGA
ncbi:MAG TPA: extracellular solute-binding protein [Thermoleophilaceae bacterium]|nr:extracellular solute-binding protein [Thermoleophilaceae bacterium]